MLYPKEILPMKKIIVPTDFSEFAQNALSVALEIAKKADSEIILLHILYVPGSQEIRINETEFYVSESEDSIYLKNIAEVNQITLQDIIRKTAYPKMSYQILSGNVTNTIVETTTNLEGDLIIMGTQGNSKYDEFFVGSNAEKVVRLAPCPVMTIRRLPQPLVFEHIVFACNLDEKSTYPIEKVKEFQSFFGAKLHLLHVNTPANFNPSKDLYVRAKKFIREHHLENIDFHVYCDYIEDDGVVHFAKSISANLIAMVSHKRTGLSRFFVGSVSEGVVSESTIPVLTFSLRN
jgi:nucleotide-binding universal stress UspA family protein